MQPPPRGQEQQQQQQTALPTNTAQAPPPPPPLLQTLLVETPLAQHAFDRYITFADPGPDDVQKENDHPWIQIVLNASTPNAAAACRFLRNEHSKYCRPHSNSSAVNDRGTIATDSALLSSPWEQLQQQTKQQLLDVASSCRSIPLGEQAIPSAGALTQVYNQQRSQTSYMFPLTQKQMSMTQSPSYTAFPVYEYSTHAELILDDTQHAQDDDDNTQEHSDKQEQQRKKSRRITGPSSSSSSSNVFPHHRLLSVGLGRQVVQLFHVYQQKQRILQQHQQQLIAFIAEKRKRIQQQQQQQATTIIKHEQQQPQDNSSSAAVRSITDDAKMDLQQQHIHPPTLETAASRITAPSSSLSSLLPLDPQLIHTPLAVHSPAALLALFPSIVAIHLVHRGFVSYSQQALSVLSHVTIDYITQLATQIKIILDQQQQYTGNKGNKKKKQQKKSNNEEKNGTLSLSRDSPVDALQQCVLERAGVASIQELLDWWNDHVVKGSNEVSRTEQRLSEMESNMTQTLAQLLSAATASSTTQAQAVVPMNIDTQHLEGRPSGGSRNSQFNADPFSPILSSASLPRIPQSPPPLPSPILVPELFSSSSSSSLISSSLLLPPSSSVSALSAADLNVPMSSQPDTEMPALESAPAATNDSIDMREADANSTSIVILD